MECQVVDTAKLLLKNSNLCDQNAPMLLTSERTDDIL